MKYIAPGIAPATFFTPNGQKTWKIKVSSSLSNLNLSDEVHILRICSGHEFYRFWKFQVHPTIFSYKNLDFLVEGGGGRRCRRRCSGAPNPRKSWKIMVSSSLSNLNLSDEVHILRICSGHEFYRFWEFQVHPIFFLQKSWFFGRGGGRRGRWRCSVGPNPWNPSNNQGFELVE